MSGILSGAVSQVSDLQSRGLGFVSQSWWDWLVNSSGHVIYILCVYDKVV